MYNDSVQKPNDSKVRLIPIPGKLNSESSLLNSILDRLTELEEYVQSINSIHKRRIAVKSRDSYELIEVESIIRCEASGSYTHIFLFDRRQFTVAKTLKQFQQELSSDTFIRIHQSHLVNQKFIKSISLEACMLQLIDDKKIPFSRRKKEIIKSSILNQ
jgi:two-component system LytT family response regulator